MFKKKAAKEVVKKGISFNPNIIIGAAIWGLAVYAGFKAYKMAVMEYERVLPRAITKISIMARTADGLHKMDFDD